jgi:hypothetical protein
MPPPLLLSDIWPIAEPGDFKIHFARWNGQVEPLEVWARDKLEWQGWQEYRPSRNEFSRPHVFALIQFYHEPDSWLFGGVFDIVARHADRYEVRWSELGKNLCGRLKLHARYKGRTTRANFEKHYPELIVAEILPEPYAGRAFAGYDNIHLSFEELQTLVRNERLDWKTALESVKGVYLIVDTRTGARYVGAALGDEGIWSRWRAYAETGHGGNVELKPLVEPAGLVYCRAHFRFTLLEHLASRCPDELVRRREEFWKQALDTRGKGGLNRN